MDSLKENMGGNYYIIVSIVSNNKIPISHSRGEGTFLDHIYTATCNMHYKGKTWKGTSHYIQTKGVQIIVH